MGQLQLEVSLWLNAPNREGLKASMNHMRRALEDTWKERLRIVRTRYRLAIKESRLLLDEQKSGLVPEPDGSFAYRQALQKEKKALAEYRRVLEICADLTMHDKLPQEDAAGEP